MLFSNSLDFSMIQRMLAFWSLVPLPFLKPAWTSGSSRFTYCRTWLENFEHYFTSVWDECSCATVWAFFGIAFLWDWNENWPFPILWPLLSFPNLLAYWVQHFHSIIFQRKQRSNCQHPLDHQKSKRVPEKHLFLLYWLYQSLWQCWSQQTVENT